MSSEASDRPNSQNFVHGWANEASKDRYLLHAREVYDHLKISRAAAYQGHIDYGKWLIASLLAVHGGAIYAINSIRSAVRPDQIAGLINGAAWNLAGVMFILLSGFCAWLNFQFSERIYDKWTNPAMLYRTDMWPRDNEKFDPVGATLFSAAAFGLMSGFSFLASAIGVIQTLKLPIPPGP